MSCGHTILLTGASGYLGGLIATALLSAEPRARILAPIRSGHDAAALYRQLAEELAAAGDPAPQSTLDRLEFAALPPAGSIHELARRSLDLGVDEIVHCAACLDYFDKPGLEAINVGMTREMLALGGSIGVRRFTYVSTAFSSGYVGHRIAETVHDEPDLDPTDYTSTKRRAERCVAESGLPYLILRPSIVIGHSQDGRYSGKRYGLYQLWSGIERLLCREWHETIHAYAPLQPTNLVHQDAFQNAFIAARRQLPDDRILNIVAADEAAPSVRDLWTLWLDACNRPLRRIYYERMADIPSRELPPSQRALLALASVNLEIIGHPWHFERGGLEALIADGLDFPEARLPSIERCQRRLMDNSPAIQKFLERHQRQFALAS